MICIEEIEIFIFQFLRFASELPHRNSFKNFSKNNHQYYKASNKRIFNIIVLTITGEFKH